MWTNRNQAHCQNYAKIGCNSYFNNTNNWVSKWQHTGLIRGVHVLPTLGRVDGPATHFVFDGFFSKVNTNYVESSVILLHGIIKHHQKGCIYTIFNAYIMRFIVKTLLNTTHEKSFPPCCVYRKLALVYDIKNKYENQYINWTSVFVHKIYLIHNCLYEINIFNNY